jgi:energy-coupling factor transporter ATP-binding protein EcfA2
MTQNITSLTVRGYKGIPGEITLKPEGKSLLVLAGANGAGKSSFIDAIAEIFDPKGTRITSRPINSGATEAEAEVVTTEARIVRKWKDNGPGTLAAYALDGAKYPSGKDFIVKATGGALFDPQEFVNLDEKKQRDQLLARVELPFNLDEITAKRKGFFDARTDVGRDVTRLEAQLKGYAPADPSIPVEEVSAAAILAEHEEARAYNSFLAQQVNAIASVQGEIESASANVTRLIDELDAARTSLSRAHETEAALKAKFAKLAGRIDTDAITARLATVEETNAKVRQQAHRAAVAAELADKTAERDALTAKLEAIDKAKVDGLAAAKFPVGGLSVDENGITFGGIPFKQVNTAKKTAIAFDLATLPQPDLRLIVIKDGDSLDADTLAGIEQIATARGYIVLVERDRDESREIGFTIVDGEVAA